VGAVVVVDPVEGDEAASPSSPPDPEHAAAATTISATSTCRVVFTRGA
jgi:hypothetical protein